MVAALCGVFGSGSVESELTWWQVPGTMHHLDQTSINPLRLKQMSEGRSRNQIKGGNEK